MRRLLIVLVLVVPAAFGYVLYRAAGNEPGAAPPPAPRPTDTTWPRAVPAAKPVAETGRAVPSPSSSPSPSPPAAPNTAPVTIPEPFVQTFGGESTVRPLPRLPSPTATLSMPVNVDGCDHSYGERTQCIPWRFPPGVPDTCAWLRERGFLDTPLSVRGADRHKLDPDGDGFACNP